MDEVLTVINEIVREEKGTRVTIGSLLRDAELDSFGITMLFIALEDEYGYFAKAGIEEDPFKMIAYDTITIREIVETCMS